MREEKALSQQDKPTRTLPDPNLLLKFCPFCREGFSPFPSSRHYVASKVVGDCVSGTLRSQLQKEKVIMEEEMIRANNPHPTWIVTGLVEGIRQSRYFKTFDDAKDFANQLPEYHTPISIYKAELVAERA